MTKRKNRGERRRERAVEPEVKPPSGRWTIWVAALLLLAIATFAAYSGVLHQGFIDLDDPQYISHNPMVQRGLTVEGLRWAFTTHHASNWHPLTWLSHMLDCQLFGLEPAGHHLVNLLLHTGSALLLLVVMRRITGSLPPALLIAGLFALHPLHVESVAWLAERKDVLSTLFWMLTLWAYLHYCDRRSRGRYALVATAFALGLLAKPMLVTLPFVLLLLDYWPLKRLQGKGEEASLGETLTGKDLVLEKMPLLAMAAFSSWMTLRAQERGGAVADLDLISFGERITNALVSYVAYIGKLIWPQNLAVFYPHRGDLPLWQPTLALLLLLALSVLVLRRRRQEPYLLVGWLWYLGTLFPVIGIVQVGGQAMADRYTYIPTIGLFLMLAMVLAPFLETSSRHRNLLAAAALVILALLGLRTRQQVALWADSFTLFHHSVEVTEGNFKLHNSLAGLYINAENYPRARQHLDEALQLLPGYADAHVNLGLLEFRSGDIEAAVENYRRALLADPQHALARDNLGHALAASGNEEQAVEQFEQALEIDEGEARTHHNLATALLQQGRLEEAIKRFDKAIEIDSGYANAWAGKADALARGGRVAEATELFEVALQLDPDHLQAHFNLGRLRAASGDTRAALTHFQKAVALAPELPEPHFYLGLAHLYSGDISAAREQLEILGEISPPAARQLQQAIEGSGQ